MFDKEKEKAILLERLKKYEDVPFTAKLKRSIEEELRVYLAGHGLAAVGLEVTCSDDGIIEFNAKRYVPLTELN